MRIVKSALILAASEGIFVACHAATLYLYANRFEEAPLADYLVAMAGIGIASCVLSLGLYSAVLYYGAKKSDQPRQAVQILFTSLTMIGAVGAVLLAVIVVLADPISRLYFNAPGRTNLLLAASALLIARMVLTITGGYCWSRGSAVPAALLKVTVIGLIPLGVVLAARPLDVAWLLGETALLSLLVLGVFLWREAARAHLGVRDLFDRSIAKQLLPYGLPRIPAVVGSRAIFALPVVLATWMGCASLEVVVIGSSMALLRMLTVSAWAVTVLVMPRISRASEDDPASVKKNVPRLVLGSILVGVAAVGVFMLAGDTVLEWWLQRPGLPTGGITFYFWLSVAPFLVFVVTRPIIDGLSTRAYITLNVLLSIGVMLAGIFVLDRFTGTARALAVGTALGMTSLAVLNLVAARRLMRVRSVEGAVPAEEPMT